MAQKGNFSKTTVRRIKATDDTPVKNKKAVESKTTKSSTKKSSKPAKASLLGSIVGYFKGAWHELKLVRWPTRSATWAMTAAVLIFTLLFVVIILLLDAGFNWLFEQILK